MITADIPEDIRRMLGGIPAENREEVMKKIFTELDESTLADIHEDDVEVSEDTPTDRLTWIQRRQSRAQVPLTEQAIHTRNIRELWPKEETSTESKKPSSILRDYVDRIRLKHGEDAANDLFDSTTELVASSSQLEDGVCRPQEGFNGLVVGSIQSGKSASFLGLTSAYIDNGGKVIVVLSGLTDKLRNQTQKRLNNDIIRHEEDRVYSPTDGGDLSSYRPGKSNSEKIWSPLRAACVKHLRQDDSAIVIVTKKNYVTLQALDTLLGYLKGKKLLGENPVLILDDECDHASINTLSELWDGVSANIKAPRIHKDIVSIRTNYPAVYWGYTATPQAQIFQHPEDALAPQRVHVLESHKHYLGPVEVFETHRNLLVDPCAITDLSLPRGNDIITHLRALKKPPNSLIKAMLNHALSGSLHHLQPRRFMPHQMHHSMMVHVCREILGQDEVYRLVELAKTEALKLLNKSLTSEVTAVSDTIARFRANRLALRTEHIGLPRSAAIIDAAINVLNTSEMLLLNSVSRDELEYDNTDTPDNLIVIGGDILSRGLTIEGLRTTYFVREPSSAVIDSTLQSARWFGPLRQDKDMISIHLPLTLAERFQKIAWSDAQLRDEFRHINEEGLAVSEARISHHPGYHPTRKRKNALSIRSAGDRISVRSPWIGTDDQAVDALKKSLKKLHARGHSELKSEKDDLQGVLYETTLDKMEEFVEAQVVSARSSDDFKDALNRIRQMKKLPGGGPAAHIVVRNGSGKNMKDEMPKSMQDLELSRIIRRSRNGLRIDQVASGKTPGKSMYTSDWFIDGFRPSSPTATLRGWRTTRDPVLLIVYIIDEHPLPEYCLRGKGPWICYAFQFPHSGPGGSLSLNKHRRGGVA